MSHWVSPRYAETGRLLAIRSFMMVLVCSGAQATELDVTAYSDTKYTSNAGLVTTATKSDVIEKIGLNVLFLEQRKRFDAQANFNLAQEYYLKNSFSQQTDLTTGFGLFNFDIIEDFLDWRTSFTRTQSLSNTTLANTPDNRGERNVLKTGPSINYRINSVSTFDLGANFTQVENSGDTAIDSKRVGANAGYNYQYNSITTMSLGGSYDEIIEIDQKNTASNDEVRNSNLNVGFAREFSQGLFNLTVGVTQVSSDSEETVTGNFFRLNFERQQFFLHDVSINYSESISDSSIGFDELTLIEDSGEVEQVNIEESSLLDIITLKQSSIVFTRSLDAFQYSVSSFWNDKDYEIQLNDEQSLGFFLGLKYRIHEAWAAGFSYRHDRQKFFDLPELGQNVTHTYKVDSDYQWTQTFSSNAYVAYERRQNDKSAIREYEEFSVGVTLSVKLY